MRLSTIPLLLVIPLLASEVLADRALQGPLHAFAWSKPPDDCAEITPMIWVRRDSDPRELAAQSRQRPSGRAALFIWDLERDLLSNPADVCRTADGQPTEYLGVWPDHGIATVRERVQKFFTAFQAAGGRCDYLILDYEGGYSNWHMRRQRAERLAAIAADPRSAELCRKMGTDELARIADLGTGLYLQWNALAGELKDRAVDAAVFDPVRNLYPQVKCSNYGSYIMTRENAVPDLNGHLQWSISHCGTHQSKAFYGHIGQLARRKLAGDRPYGDGPFDVLRWQLNTMRAIMRSSDDPFQPWISHKNFAQSRFRDNDYYTELIYHLALSGAEDFLYWNPGMWRQDQKPEEFRTDKHDRLVNSLLAELNAKFGLQPRNCLTLEPMPWDSPLIATGMKVGDRFLWRITAPPGTPAIQAGEQRLELNGELGLWLEGSREKVQFRLAN